MLSRSIVMHDNVKPIRHLSIERFFKKLSLERLMYGRMILLDYPLLPHIIRLPRNVSKYMARLPQI